MWLSSDPFWAGFQAIFYLWLLLLPPRLVSRWLRRIWWNAGNVPRVSGSSTDGG